MAADVLGREINVDDFVFYYNSIYQVLGVGKTGVKAIIYPKSSTSRNRTITSRECCLLPKEEVLLKILKTGKL